MARPITDQPPDDHFYLNMDGCFEREENAMSSRYGTTIIDRDPVGAGNNNYLFSAAPVTISRLRSLQNQTYRYVGLADGTLWRRTTDTQGQFTQILPGLSGLPFSTLVNTCFESAQPYLFIYDRGLMLKDNGVGTPTRIGIFAPNQPVIATQYAPQIQIIDPFQTSSGYGPSGMSVVSVTTVATVTAAASTAILNYRQYTDSTQSYINTPDGMVATSVSNPDGALRLKFNTILLNNTFDIVATNNVYSGSDSFTFKQVTFSIAQNTTGFIGKNFVTPLNLSTYQPDDLIVIVLQVSGPAAIQEIRVMFDVSNGGYNNGPAHYYKSITPVSYQGSITLPQTNDPNSAMSGEVYNLATGITNIRQLGQPDNLPTNDPVLPGVQPSQMTSGVGSWSVIYLRKGDFQPAGNAGSPGLDWSNVTGWRVQVTTNAQGSSNISFNGLYIQGSPTSTGIGTLAGASSYGGVGYDFRYIYYNINTGTPSNPSGSNYFSATPQNPGASSTLVVLRQAIDLQMTYSSDPQVTHIKIFARGGLYGQNWFYADQIPNVVGGGSFHYRYILPDSSLTQGNILGLANDVPVTSTLQTPINAVLSVATGPSPNLNIPRLTTFITTSLIPFVPNQIVDIGTPQNLEQIIVISTSQNGDGTQNFTGYVQLPHATGEPVQAFAVPGQPLYLAAKAYNQTWLAGDPNNPHFLYYTPVGFPENCPPQDYIPVGTASDPITAVINFSGVLLVRTYSTWYQIFPGNPPYAQTTNSKHGSPANFDWCITENAIFYQAFDGIRTFVGTEGQYKSLIIEWLYRGTTLTPVPLVNTNLLGSVISAFKDNTATFAYTGLDGKRYTIAYSTVYQRWRNSNIPITAIYTEPDTNIQLFAKPMNISGVSGWALVQFDNTLDYDDGGWVNGVLAQLPIPINLQSVYFDEKLPNNQKQWNFVTLDINPNGQTITPTLLFDDNNGSVPPIVLSPPITGAQRAKFSFNVNAGLGQAAYRISLLLTGSVTVAPIIYQAELYSATLADQRQGFDTYWVRLGSDESKLIKQGYFDYTSSAPINVSLYADGNPIPYFTFTLPTNSTRGEVPTRVRFPALKCRLWRLVMTSTAQFQLWNPVQTDTKLICGPKGYQRAEVREMDMTKM